MILNPLHNDFKLNGRSFDTVNDLLSYCKINAPILYSFLIHWFDQNDKLIIQTSGSTGTKKKISVKKTHMINSATATGHFFNLEPKTKALLCLSVDYIAGKMMLVRAMVLGWYLDVVKPSSDPLRTIEKSYDFAAMVPMQLIQSMDRLNSIKKIIVGGGEVPLKVQKDLQHLKTEVYATYGMTETVTHIAVKALNKVIESSELSSCYQAFPTVSLDLDHRGCLMIEASNIMDKPIITNDLVELYSDNQFKWLGRFDHLINTGGFKIIPEDVESKLQYLIPDRYIIAAKSDDQLGEKVILIIESQQEEYDAAALLERIVKIPSLHKYEMPKKIYFVNKFIETETKKIQRKETCQSLL